MTAKPAEKSTLEINRLNKAPCDPAHATLTESGGGGNSMFDGLENFVRKCLFM